mmetsp:Transcript_14469/g.37462  ORF Transcript_14469/g.37462 Transcript_14469/m.37462 type:complete len:226 (+) Transcript_14469:670-1347(+)
MSRAVAGASVSASVSRAGSAGAGAVAAGSGSGSGSTCGSAAGAGTSHATSAAAVSGASASSEPPFFSASISCERIAEISAFAVVMPFSSRSTCELLALSSSISCRWSVALDSLAPVAAGAPEAEASASSFSRVVFSRVVACCSDSAFAASSSRNGRTYSCTSRAHSVSASTACNHASSPRAREATLASVCRMRYLVGKGCLRAVAVIERARASNCEYLRSTSYAS